MKTVADGTPTTGHSFIQSNPNLADVADSLKDLVAITVVELEDTAHAIALVYIIHKYKF